MPVLYNIKSDCCGCSACYDMCPKKAKPLIAVIQNIFGYQFYTHCIIMVIGVSVIICRQQSINTMYCLFPCQATVTRSRKEMDSWYRVNRCFSDYPTQLFYNILIILCSLFKTSVDYPRAVVITIHSRAIYSMKTKFQPL